MEEGNVQEMREGKKIFRERTARRVDGKSELSDKLTGIKEKERKADTEKETRE